MGMLRIFLALSVISAHTESTVLGFKGVGPQYAVNLFFIISGFYMAMVLNEKYLRASPFDFYKSRILRIFPIYYVGLFLMLLISFDSIVYLFNQLSSAAKLFFIFQNLLIFGQDLSYILCAKTLLFECARPVALTINPPTWSLAVELGFYMAAPYLLKSTTKTFLFVLFGCAYLISINKINFPLNAMEMIRSAGTPAYHYHFYPSSFVFFGSGALAYHLNKLNSHAHYIAGIMTIMLTYFAKTAIPFWHMIFICLVMPLLFHYTSASRMDRLIGQLSYPIYILHIPVMLFIRQWTQSNTDCFGFMSLGTQVAVVSFMIGWMLYLLIEKKINRYQETEKLSDKASSSETHLATPAFPMLLLSAYVFFPIATITYIYAVQYEIFT